MRAIFAVNAIGGFGDDSGLPWARNPADLKRFKQYTTGKTVLMGANTWSSDMPKPLPNRKNCVLSSTLEDDRCTIYRSIGDFLRSDDYLTDNDNIYVIGGAKTLWEFRPYINTVYLTVFKEIRPAPVTMHIESYLDGFRLDAGEFFIDHRFEVWSRI